MHHKSYYKSTSFLDLLFNMLLGFVFLFSIAFMMVNPEIKKANVKNKAEYIITMEWHENSMDDVDLWIQDPLGNLVFFRQKDIGLTHLDRDDRGEVNDMVLLHSGVVKKIPGNREVASIRGFIPGEWVINVHMYSKKEVPPCSVRIRMDKLNPKVKTVFHKKVTLRLQKEEITITRFTMTAMGDILAFEDLPKSLVMLAPVLQGAQFLDSPHGGGRE